MASRFIWSLRKIRQWLQSTLQSKQCPPTRPSHWKSSSNLIITSSLRLKSKQSKISKCRITLSSRRTRENNNKSTWTRFSPSLTRKSNIDLKAISSVLLCAIPSRRPRTSKARLNAITTNSDTECSTRGFTKIALWNQWLKCHPMELCKNLLLLPDSKDRLIKE